MPKASRDALNAKGKTDVWYFDPDAVILVEEKGSPVYDERVHLDFDEGLVLSMIYAPDGKTPQGVLKILSGSRNPETGKVEIDDGRQRAKACREANRRLKKQGLPLLRLPVHLKRLNDSQRMALMLTSNAHHKEDTPMHRALKAQRYINLGHDEREVSVMLGTSESTIKNLLRLLDAPAVVRAAVDAGKITTSDAYRLSREEPAEAKKLLDKLLEHAPRTPGKKRSKNAKKAREVMGKPKPKDASARDTKKLETEVAEAIAAWIEATWGKEDNWGGAPSEIPGRIRKGEWRASRSRPPDLDL